MIKHQNDEKKDKKITIVKDHENIDFNGLPVAWAFELEVQFRT